MNKTLQIVLGISALLIAVSIFYYFVISHGKSKSAECQKLVQAFEQKFETDIKSQVGVPDSFVTPRGGYNKNLDECLARVGYTYGDHGGESTNLYVYNVQTDTVVLMGSDGVAYENIGGTNYNNPAKNDVLSLDIFNVRAEVLLNQ